MGHGNTQLPIFFIAGISGDQLAGLVLRCLNLLNDTGVTVCSITFDGAPNNLRMAKTLGCSLVPSELKTFFYHPDTGDKVYIFLDPCHMLKLVRNTIGQKILLSSDGAIKFEFIEKLFKLQEAEGLHFANKLTKGHINWFDQKMKVKLAAQTLSESVSVAIDYCCKKKIAGFEESEATAIFLRHFNFLFDVLNSRTVKSFAGKKALCEENSESHKEIMLNLIDYIKNLKNVDGSLVISSNRKIGFLGFIVCILSTIGLYEDLVLNKKVFKYIPMYKISQDKLELLFAKIQSKGGWNNNPTAIQFVSTLKKIIIATELSDLKSGNCIPMESIHILHASSATPPTANPMMNINLT